MNYEEMNVNDLKQIAKEKGVKNISKFKKEDIIAILKELDTPSENTNKEKSVETNFTEVTTSEGYKLTNEGDEVITRYT